MSEATVAPSVIPPLLIGVFLVFSTEAVADTLPWALAEAYRSNPQLNAQRAAVRASDENVPQALSGYRPRINLTTSIGQAYSDNATSITGPTGAPVQANSRGSNTVQSYGGTITQNLLNGFQTANRTRQAEFLVSAARENLRVTEQTVLLAAATAYMNLLRDSAILDLQRRNVEVLLEQVRQTNDRFKVGEVTRTDVAQSEARLSSGKTAVLTAESNYTTSRASYRQAIGHEPGKLAPGMPVDRFSPLNLRGAISTARAGHPGVTTSMFNVEAAMQQVKLAEGALYPTLNLVGSVQKNYGSTSAISLVESLSASATAQLSVPVYQGGSEYSVIRQAKETLQQRRVDLDASRDQVQQAITQAWGQLESAKAQIVSTQATVNAAEIALNGVREEARVGQRTTLDVLNAQQELVNARVSLVTAQRDRIVASYTVLGAGGRLSPQVLGLAIPTYDPITHYTQIRDTWAGVRTPDGK